jgi:hypothetical protein
LACLCASVRADIIGVSLRAGKTSCGFIFGPIGNTVEQTKTTGASRSDAEREAAMEIQPTRRSVMAGIGAAAAAPALAPIAAVAGEDPGGPATAPPAIW